MLYNIVDDLQTVTHDQRPFKESDSRWSAIVLGIFSIMMILVIFVLFIVTDIVTVGLQCHRLKSNLRFLKERHLLRLCNTNQDTVIDIRNTDPKQW